MKRFFIAIPLPEKVKEVLFPFFKNTARLKEVKWEKPEKLHLTLAFLGRVEEKRIKELTLLLDSIKVNYKPLALKLIPKICAFPDLSSPRVLWLPIEGETKKLQKITDSLRKSLLEKNFTFDERPYFPHLTIGRFRKDAQKWQKENVLKTIEGELPKAPMEFKAGNLTLFESELTPKGSVYKQVCKYRLQT